MIRDSRWRVATTVSYGATVVVQAVGCDRSNRGERASFLLPFEPWTAVETRRPRVVSSSRWRHVARTALAQATPSWWSLRSAARADLAILPYQLEPALAMVRGDANRVLIADAVGLGKTVQAGLMIAEMTARETDAKALVVCPAGLRDQWCDELRLRFGLDARIVDAGSMARMTRELPPHVNPWATHAVAVTSIDFIKRPDVIRGFEGLAWDIAIFDEAHNLASYSDRATAAGLVAERARHVVLLTATPHSGDEDAFARLCGIGELGNRDALLVFRRARSDVGTDRPSRSRLVHVGPTTAERLMHDAVFRYARQVWRRDGASPGARLAASVLMRRACSSASSLVRSAERRLALLAAASDNAGGQASLPFGAGILDDEPDSQLSSPGFADLNEECRQLEFVLERARAATAHESKIAALQRLLARIDEPAILFTEYRDTLKRLAEALDLPDALQLHGGLTRSERTDVLTRFTRGRSRLLLATDTGSEGLNLHHRCRLVINLELPWMPRRLEQRAGRVDRIGQSRRVHVLSLVAKGTCEEEILARLTTRARRAEKAMDLLSRSPSEEGIAAMALGGEPATPGMEPAVTLPPGVVAAPVTDAASEGTRIVTARLLNNRAADPAIEDRAVLTRMRRGRGNRPSGRFWLFTFACRSPQEQVVWQAMFAIRAEAGGRTNGSAVHARLALDPALVDLGSALSRHVAGVAGALSLELAGPVRRWLEREEAIVQRLRERHARMSVNVVQPGLLDRRVYRLATEYDEALQAALSRSSLRIARLIGLGDLRTDAASLVFGLLLE